MGLFDSWRRKKQKRTEFEKPREPKKVVSEVAADESIKSDQPETITSLLGKYYNLVERREALKVERKDLTTKLEAGKIKATEFRKELMARIQEAARVSETLREMIAKLTQLGYRGTLQ
jgi:LPS O-antigen subunit length determinant protein (WzzB/FepE family)